MNAGSSQGPQWLGRLGYATDPVGRTPELYSPSLGLSFLSLNPLSSSDTASHELWWGGGGRCGPPLLCGWNSLKQLGGLPPTITVSGLAIVALMSPSVVTLDLFMCT